MTLDLDRMPPGGEMLDDLEADPRAVAESLRNIARSNRWFGGRSAVRFGFRRLLGGRSLDQVVVLDVGTGFGDIPRDLVGVGAALGLTVRAVGLDRHPAAARVAFGRGLPTVLADGTALPFDEQTVDIVIISQVAHHLTPRQIVALAREATRVARLGVVLADLRRSRLAAFGFGIASRVLRFDRTTRVDGVTSVRRGFERGELEALLRDGGIPAIVVTRPIARLVATWSRQL